MLFFIFILGLYLENNSDIKYLKDYFENENIKKVFHNIG